MAESDAERDAMKEALFNKDKFDTYDVDVASKMKLKPIKSDNRQLFLMMDGKTDEVDITSGIWRNYDLFCRLIKEQLEVGMYVKEIYKGFGKADCASILRTMMNTPGDLWAHQSTGIPLGLATRSDYVADDRPDQEKHRGILLPTRKPFVERIWRRSSSIILNLKVDGFPRG